MESPKKSRRGYSLLSYFYAIGILLVSTGLLLPFRGLFSLAVIALLYIVPVGISASLWGLVPGIFTSIAAFFILNFSFIQPYYSLTVHRLQDITMLFVFLGLTISFSRLVGQMKESLATAQARENEITRLYELSLALSKLHREGDILSGLAQRTFETFSASRIEVFIQSNPPILASFPTAQDPDMLYASQPESIVSMQGAQYLLGEIQLWRAHPLNPAELRLLGSFATQGVLALERVRLTASESRARVLEESDKMKSSLLSSVSHELRTPLATIKASVTTLQSVDTPLPAEARKDLLAAIDEETDHLNQLVGNLLNMSRIEAGALKLKNRWNVLSDIAASAATRARKLASNEIKLDIPDELPLVFVDDVLMEQVFGNLLSNSQKYSASGTPIRIRARQSNEVTIRVSVENQSPPVSEADLERIFEKFHRVTAADQITGTGLGLSICKGIVEAHQGRIWAANLSDGFAIEFEIPINSGGLAPLISQP